MLLLVSRMVTIEADELHYTRQLGGWGNREAAEQLYELARQIGEDAVGDAEPDVINALWDEAMAWWGATP
jgi:hypothetical protein